MNVFKSLAKHCFPLLVVALTLMFVDATITTDCADARSKSGGKSFSMPTGKSSPQQAPSQFNQRQQQTPQSGGFGRGLMGGLLGGAIGGLLFGSLFGASGSGMGILPLLLLGGVGYLLYKRFVNRPSTSSGPGYQPPPAGNVFQGQFGGFGAKSAPPAPPVQQEYAVEDGLNAIRQTDSGFDDKYFLEVASDVFFKVQAGWMRRDLTSYRHLLGEQLATEYDQHFKEMQAKGHVNKLESIAIRKVEIVAAGSQDGEDFVTVLFTANLLDYTVDETSGALVEGSMTEPVKFAEQWTWARPIRTENWKLEGIEVVAD